MVAELPSNWADDIHRAKLWKTGLSKLFIGSTLSVRVGFYQGAAKTIKFLQAVHVHNNKPSIEARKWLDEQVAERRRWFK